MSEQLEDFLMRLNEQEDRRKKRLLRLAVLCFGLVIIFLAFGIFVTLRGL